VDGITLNYTRAPPVIRKVSSITHRGAYLNAVSNILVWAMPHHPVYLWTLADVPLQWWCFPWTIAAMAGTNVCLRRVEAARSSMPFANTRVSHYCGAPIVHATLINAASELKSRHSASVCTRWCRGGAARGDA